MPSVSISTNTPSAAIPTCYIAAKATMASISFSSSAAGNTARLEATLDDPMRVATPTWFAASSLVYASTTYFDSGAFVQILAPIAGLRLTSTAVSSGTVTLRALQNAGS